MKNFEFVALNSAGRKEIGEVRAWRLEEAKRKVQQKGFYLVSIRIKDGSVSRIGKNPSFFDEIKNILFPKVRISRI
jgi:type II secretory pathway component PulF